MSVRPSVPPSVRHTRVECLRNGLNLNKMALGTCNYAIKRQFRDACRSSERVCGLNSARLVSVPFAWLNVQKRLTSICPPVVRDATLMGAQTQTSCRAKYIYFHSRLELPLFRPTSPLSSSSYPRVHLRGDDPSHPNARAICLKNDMKIGHMRE